MASHYSVLENKNDERGQFAMDTLTIVILIYSVWAFYSGWKVLTGRSEFLDRKAFPSVMLKIVLSFVVGSVYGVIYFIALIFKVFGRM